MVSRTTATDRRSSQGRWFKAFSSESGKKIVVAEDMGLCFSALDDNRQIPDAGRDEGPQVNEDFEEGRSSKHVSESKERFI